MRKEKNEMEKGYVLAVCYDSDYYIPNAEHIERNDSLIPWLFPDDAAAAKGAEADGVPLIYGMDDVPDGIYIDSPKNREVIIGGLNERAHQAEVQDNKAKMFSDLPECTLLFHRLERELGGKHDGFAEWLRISYELNEDFYSSPLEMATNICDAFMESKQMYGAKIAHDLYDSRIVILPNEIRSASRYLSLGGQMESLEALAHVGFLMENLHSYAHEDVVRTAEFINGGGAAESAFAVLSCQPPSEPERQCGMTQQMG